MTASFVFMQLSDISAFSPYHYPEIMNKSFCILLLVTFVAFTFTGIAQNDKSIEIIKIESELTGGSYQLTIVNLQKTTNGKLHLFLDSETSSKTLIEGWTEENFTRDQCPTLAVLKIENKGHQITRDLTQDALQGIPGSGGADIFKEFLLEVVLPKINTVSGVSFSETILHTKGRAAAFGFYVLFQDHPDFDTFLFESPNMEWHEGYAFRAEYAYYKAMHSRFPAKTTILPFLTETTPKSLQMLDMLDQLLKYRQYKENKCEFLEPKSTESSDRFSILLPILQTE